MISGLNPRLYEWQMGLGWHGGLLLLWFFRTEVGGLWTLIVLCKGVANLIVSS